MGFILQSNFFLERSLREIITLTFQMQISLSIILTLGCFYEKDTNNCLTMDPYKNKTKNKTEFLFRFVMY